MDFYDMQQNTSSWRQNFFPILKFSSVQCSRSVVSNSLRPHESQQTRPPCPSPTPRVHSNSCPSSQWCHPAISSSVDPFSSCPQSLPAPESFPMSQLFAWKKKQTQTLLCRCCLLPGTHSTRKQKQTLPGRSILAPVLPAQYNLPASPWLYMAHWDRQNSEMVPKILAPDVHALYKTLLSVSRTCEYNGLLFPWLCSVTEKKGGFCKCN